MLTRNNVLATKNVVQCGRHGQLKFQVNAMLSGLTGCERECGFKKRVIQNMKTNIKHRKCTIFSTNQNIQSVSFIMRLSWTIFKVAKLQYTYGFYV